MGKVVRGFLEERLELYLEGGLKFQIRCFELPNDRNSTQTRFFFLSLFSLQSFLLLFGHATRLVDLSSTTRD